MTHRLTYGTPAEMGFVREPRWDGYLRDRHPGWLAWKTPEKVVLALPDGCDRIGLAEIVGPRGVTLACLDPPGVFSLWRFPKRKDDAVQ